MEDRSELLGLLESLKKEIVRVKRNKTYYLRKRRSYQGDYSVKLNKGTAEVIRQLKRDLNLSNVYLASVFKISPSEISLIIHRHTWVN